VEKFMVDKGIQLGPGDSSVKSLPLLLNEHGSRSKHEAAKRSKAGEASRDNEWAQKDITERPQN
jgi:hypothetical protein